MLSQITPVILTYNEAPNIERTLAALAWADKVLVVDSFSTDNTVELCGKHANVKVVQREFDQHTEQWNFAIDQVDAAKWILALDADHVVSQQLQQELANLAPPDHVHAYQAQYQYLIDGTPLRTSLYPPLLALFRYGSGRYQQDGHTQRFTLEKGSVATLTGKIQHDDRKPEQRWLQSQLNYARLEVNKLRTSKFSDLSLNDKVRRLPWLAPILVVPYMLVRKGLVLDGLAGLRYVRQRFIAEAILQRQLWHQTSTKD